jgi:hypothetical protein
LFFFTINWCSPEYKKADKQDKQDKQESEYMNRDNRDRLYHVISSNSVCQDGFLFVKIGQLFRNQQCLSVGKAKKGHLEQMEWDFGGLFVLFVTFVKECVSRKIISHKNENVLGDGENRNIPRNQTGA